MPPLPPSTHKTKLILSIFCSLLLLIGVFGAGIFIGFRHQPAINQIKNVVAKEDNKPQEVDFSIFWNVWAKLQEKYVDKDKIDSQKEVYGAVAGMVKSLDDPYTVFFPPVEAKQFQQDIKGEFGGIGAELGLRKGVITVITPLKDSPAEKAGIKIADKIIKIDEKPTNDLTLEEAVHLIRGERGTKVKLTIFRDTENEPKEFTIVRDTIRIPILDTKQKENGIFYIQLLSFNEASPALFRNAVHEFEKSKSTKLILDLRGNPGGLLTASVDIASWFLPSGDVVAREHYATKSDDIYRSSGYKVLEKIPTIILINQGSASASEILAGALRDGRNIQLIGEKSFGKGSVQELVNLPQGASLKITIAKWLTPSGKTIEGHGLDPDITITMKKEDIEAGKDTQLEKSIEIIKKL